ncbi:MAG: TolC family protein [Gammaproteobacteria bacterium]|nr:TolC family protein [Gammaproteobacteria bacterium]MCF6229974.1 TolC family protein [Gammaproteobacteria bacterium]
MLFKKYLSAGVFACLVLPVWAVPSPERPLSTLTISADVAQLVDPSLQVFIQQVWLDSPTIQGAQAAIEAARARVDGADRPLYNPALELEAERTDVNTASIGFRQTLDWGDKRLAKTRMAHSAVRFAEAEFITQRQQVAVEALEALAHYFTAREMQMLSMQRSQLMKGFLDTVQQRQAAGDMGALEGTLAHVTYSEALMKQAARESELAEAEAALRAVTGFDHVNWPPLPRQLAAPPKRIDPALLQSLPALAVLRSRMELAKSRIGLAESQGQSDPTIGFRAGREGSERLLGLTLEIPLFVRNNFKAGVRAASYDAVVEELAYHDAHRRAKARLEGTLGRFHNTARAWAAWVTNGKQAHRQQMSLLEQLWQAEELTATDYLIQAKQNIDTQTAATRLMGEVWRAAISWLDASAQVETWLGFTPAQTENSGE